MPTNHHETGSDLPAPTAPRKLLLTSKKELDNSARESVNAEEVNGGIEYMYQSDFAEGTTDAVTRLPLMPVVGLEGVVKPRRGKKKQLVVRTGNASVTYLRVSTAKQLNTGADVDEDGNSIATQRDTTRTKVRQLRSTIVAEFVDRGHSATTIAKRPAFKELLHYIDEHPEVRYVVMHMRSRAFRNSVDAGLTERTLNERGVELVSAQEDFGDGPSARLARQVIDATNEYQVAMNGEDIKLKMRHKVEQGGTVGPAPLGYLNVRKGYDGRLINSIDVDPERGPLITWAFEQYATGDYSVVRLQAALEEQGLVTRPSRKYRQKVVSTSQLHKILRNPYYTGIVPYGDDLHPGRHEPLVSKETFIEVQKILDSRGKTGDRDTVHFHFLKGLVFCKECHDAGRESRMVYSQNKGNGGVYEYFVCAAKQRRLCTMPNIRMEDLEYEVARAVAGERYDSDSIAALKSEIATAVEQEQAFEREVRSNLQKGLKKLATSEARYLDLLADGDLPVEEIKKRLRALVLQKGAVEEKLARTNENIEYGAEKAIAYLDLLAEPGVLYERADEMVRRELISILFEKLYVRATDLDSTISGTRVAANDLLHQIAPVRGHENSQHGAPETTENEEIPSTSAGDFLPLTGDNAFVSLGLSKTDLVAGAGFEPTTSGL